MRHLFLLFLPLALFGQSSFITPMEYASQLYKNPRGIGCNKCHGEKGEGKVVAHYKHKGKKRVFHPGAINSLPYEQFEQALRSRIEGMPHYYLTTQEIKALYFYLQNCKLEEQTDGK